MGLWLVGRAQGYSFDTWASGRVNLKTRDAAPLPPGTNQATEKEVQFNGSIGNIFYRRKDSAAISLPWVSSKYATVEGKVGISME